jgi:hypothetical protein
MDHPSQIVEQIARRLHEQFERLAPEHGWQSRQAGVPYEQLPENSRRLQAATVEALLADGTIEVGPAVLAGFPAGSVAEHWGALRAHR